MKPTGRFIRRLILVTAVTTAAVTSIHCQSPSIPEMVDDGINPSMYVEENGTAHLAYFREDKLIYARRSSEGIWNYRTLGIAASCRENDIVMDNEGNIHIVFSDRREDHRIVSRLFHGILTNTGAWSRKIIAVSANGFHSMTLKTDSNNEFCLVYQDAWGMASPGAQYEMHTSDGEWSKPEMFFSNGYDHVDMDIDNNDNLHVSYYSYTIGGIVYQHKSAEGIWGDPEKIEQYWGGGQLEGMVTSVVADADNNPHVSYVGQVDNDDAENIKYAWKSDGIWHYTKVDNGCFQSRGNKLILDPDGVAHFAYLFPTPKDYSYSWAIRYATNITGLWTRQTLFPEIGAYDLDMAMDGNKKIHVTYSGYGNDYIEHVYYNQLGIPDQFYVDPDTLDFRELSPGEDKTLVLTMTNPLPHDIVIDSIITDDDRLTSDRYSFTIAHNSVETVNMLFQHTAETWKDTELKIWFAGSFLSIPVLATNYQPELVVFEDPIDFGAVPLGSGRTKSVRLSNKGVTELVISDIEVKYELWGGYIYPTDFDLEGHNCATLSRDETCDVEISFNPEKAGYQTSYLIISSNDPENPLMKVRITGKTAHPQIASSLYDVDFGYCPTGESVTKPVTLINTGELNLIISTISLSGTYSNQFSLSYNCTEVEPGDSCHISITMAPTTEGDLEATLVISSNSYYASSLQIPLHGTSIDKRLQISPASVDFGEVGLGQSGQAVLELSNTGSGTIIISDIQLTGDDRYEFCHGLECISIDEGSTYKDTVWFAPVFEGIKNASLVITSNDSFHPVQSISLAGTTGDASEMHVSIEALPPGGAAPLYIKFNPVITGGRSPFYYLWDIEGIGRYTNESPDIQFTEPGIFTISLEVTDIGDTTVTAEKEIIISSATVPVVSASASPTSGEIPLTVSFDATVAGGNLPLSYLWNFGDGATSYLLNPHHEYTTPGAYWVTITVTDADNDQATDSVWVRVKWNNSMAGQLWDNNCIYEVNEAKVRLYLRTHITSVWTDNLEGTNQYLFDDKEDAEYTVLALPDTLEYPQYLPTYLGKKLTLNEATWVDVTGHITGEDICLIRKPADTGGQGSFWGHFGISSSPSKGAIYVNEGSTKDETAIPDVYIYVENATGGSLMGYDITDINGYFRIAGLENGSYYLKADYNGLPMNAANTPLIISDAEEELELSVTAGENNISVVNLTTGITDALTGGVSAYPVPADRYVYFILPDEFIGHNVKIRLYDFAGKVKYSDIIKVSGNTMQTINIEHLSEGIYLLEIGNNKDIIRQKIVIAR